MIHFISGLPRSGSTLLAGLLRQNPAFHANISSPVAGLVSALLKKMSMSNEASVFISDRQREDMLRAVFHVFYPTERIVPNLFEPCVDVSGVSFDTHRSWCARMPLLSQLFPASRVICCVRDVPWIFDSVEQLTRRNCIQPSSLFGFNDGGTVYSRMESLAVSGGLIGYAINALREACYGVYRGKLLLVRYETLTTDPAKVMDAIYKFLGQEFFLHDFENVEMEAEEFDRRMGAPGLHAVRRAVSANQRPTCLPPDLFNRYEGLTFWRNKMSGIRIV